MTLQLKDPSLLKDTSFIDGQWQGATARYGVNNPATGELLAMVSDNGAKETDLAIEAAAKAQPAWAAKTAKERSQILRLWADLLIANQDDLGLIMTHEQGKPLAEAKGEVAYAASFVEFYAEEAKRIYGEIIPSPWTDRRLLSIRQPIGVGAGITPWNFPAAMITRKAAPALAAGCAMVIKPAESTPLSALALAELAIRAGFPAGVINVVTALKPIPIGDRLCKHDKVRAISFTGSTAVGKRLLADMADTVKKASMELGGNAPFIVFDDADIDAALIGVMASKFRNAGQTCVCANRIFVQDGIYDRFMDKVRASVAKLKVGNGMDTGVEIGPLINDRAIEKVDRLVTAALAQGAKASVGGSPHALGRSFYTPSIIEGVTPDMAISAEEIFGPVASILRFKDEKDAVRMANDTPFGLAAYFFSKDNARVWRVAEGLEYGIIGANSGMVSTEVAPFGGMKQSGLGREGGKAGIEEWVETKYIGMGGL